MHPASRQVNKVQLESMTLEGDFPSTGGETLQGYTAHIRVDPFHM